MLWSINGLSLHGKMDVWRESLSVNCRRVGSPVSCDVCKYEDDRHMNLVISVYFLMNSLQQTVKHILYQSTVSIQRPRPYTFDSTTWRQMLSRERSKSMSAATSLL